MNLSVLLTGKALYGFSALSAEEFIDYNVVKAALLKRYDMNEEGYRMKFRTCRAEGGESILQFAARMSSYFDRWVELSEVGRSFDGTKDFGNELSIFIGEKSPKSVKEMAEFADKFRDARRQTGGKNQKSSQFQGGSQNQKGQPWNKSSKGKDRVDLNSNDSQEVSATCVVHEVTDASRYPCLQRRNRVELKCGHDLPIISVASASVNMMASGMPVVQGFIGSTEVEVLRDSGCSLVVVHRELVDNSQLTGESRTCVMMDGTCRKAPIARLYIDTPYYIGEVEALCMRTPEYDLIVGNISGAREPKDPKIGWKPGVAHEVGHVEVSSPSGGEHSTPSSDGTSVPSSGKGCCPSGIETSVPS
ncbi:uncharacterized protein LOC144342485, partial [Saccoglossus kowalevskii]